MHIRNCLFFSLVLFLFLDTRAQPAHAPAFRVLAFYTAKNDLAHISYVKEANEWLAKAAVKLNFEYKATSDWTQMNDSTLSAHQVVMFLDTRPDSANHREAFRRYMESGGGWIGFHFAAFALTPSAFPQNWDWYHHKFIGAGEYKSNTWRPTSAVLKVEDKHHPSTRGLPRTFSSAPNEWYRWQNDLTKNPEIKVLVSIDPKSFPLGTGPKPHEIWHSGYYPVVWTNTSYKMIYINMGHNDIDYENKTNRQLSFTFSNPIQNRLLTNALLWVGGARKK